MIDTIRTFIANKPVANATSILVLMNSFATNKRLFGIELSVEFVPRTDEKRNVSYFIAKDGDDYSEHVYIA